MKLHCEDIPVLDRGGVVNSILAGGGKGLHRSLRRDIVAVGEIDVGFFAEAAEQARLPP
jgi:hypothetical protein